MTFIRINPASTAMKLTPSIKKQSAIPTLAMRKPATAGPTMRAPLNIALFSEIAFMRSSRLAISTTNDCRAGMSKAMATPPNKPREMISQGTIFPDQTRPAKMKARIIIAVWVQRRTDRFGKRSAAQPPQVEKTSMGAVPAAATMPNNALEPVNW